MTLSSARANEALIQTYLDCWHRGDVEGALAHFVEDLTWNFFGSSSVAGTFVGRTELKRFLADFSAKVPSAEVVGVKDILVSDNRAAVNVAERWTNLAGRSLEFTRLVIYEIEDDRLLSASFYDVDQAVVAALIDG
jgi:ketosteroid isomerase-like protein